jgi:hypothetical protein
VSVLSLCLETEFTSIMLGSSNKTTNDSRYVYGPAYKRDPDDFKGMAKDSIEGIRWLSGIIDAGDTNYVVLACLDDCYDPPVFAVFGRSFEDCYEEFLERMSEDLKVEESEIIDSPELAEAVDRGELPSGYTYTPSGTLVSIESVRMWGAYVIEARTKYYTPVSKPNQ